MDERNNLILSLYENNDALSRLATGKEKDKLKAELAQQETAKNLLDVKIKEEDRKTDVLEKNLKIMFEVYGGTIAALQTCSGLNRCQFHQFKPMLDKWSENPNIRSHISKIKMTPEELEVLVKEARYQQSTFQHKNPGEPVATLNTEISSHIKDLTDQDKRERELAIATENKFNKAPLTAMQHKADAKKQLEKAKADPKLLINQNKSNRKRIIK